VIALRPATRVGPFEIDALVGATLSRDIEAGQPFEPEDLLGGDVWLKPDTTSEVRLKPDTASDVATPSITGSSG
jgi:hypothetical protein